ncbi:MAG: hypothetical protein APR63_14195 [Desulfuromonas sp. SDB]|nr:MAG: hypothetical protein APR63_14195 [Desulfuromonas sp. SDB]
MNKRSDNSYQKVVVFDNYFQAELMQKALTDAHIPFYIESYHDSAYNGLFQFQKGWGYIKAPVEYHQQIKQIYENIKSDQN